MFLIEVAHPAGAVDPDAQATIANHISHRMMTRKAAPAETLERARRVLHIRFQEASTWWTGDGLVKDGEPPPFVVTVTIPAAWREEFSSHGIAAIRGAIAEFDTQHGFVRGGGDLWVNVVGIADGSIGLNGAATDAIGVVNYITEQYRATTHEAPTLPDGVVIDPICGMRVRLGPGAITLRHDGEVVGFCSTGCRAAYADQHQLAAPQ